MIATSQVGTFATRLAATLALLVATMFGTAQAADEMVFFHVDAVGSATAAFNETGGLCWKQHYTPYGEQTRNDDASPITGCGLIGKDRGFTGHTQDESGLTYMQQRYYDASIGRFLSVDPKGVNANDTRTYNRYSYAANNPYKYVDPDGEAFFLVAVPLIKAAAVFIAKEAAVEAASQLTGGATDLLSTRRAAKRGFIEARRLFDSETAQVVAARGKNTFPDNPKDLLPELPRDAKGRIYPSNKIRIRPEKHAFKIGDKYAPRHHDQHYHVETRVDPGKSWNNKKNVTKIKPESYRLGQGTGFLPGEKFPGAD